jgi:hypothetical protein
MRENCWTVVLIVVHRVFYCHFIISLKKYDMVISIHFDCDHNEKHSRRCLAVCCIRFTLNICVV